MQKRLFFPMVFQQIFDIHTDWGGLCHMSTPRVEMGVVEVGERWEKGAQ